MRIRLQKGKGKPDTFTCERDDGTVTWTALNLPAAHDLTHYVVETTLGYQNAFYGLVAQGWEIADFGAMEAGTGKKRQIPRESISAECLVSVFQHTLLPAASSEDCYALLEMTCKDFKDFPFPTRETYAEMLTAMRKLIERWARLLPGEALELDFPAP